MIQEEEPLKHPGWVFKGPDDPLPEIPPPTVEPTPLPPMADVVPAEIESPKEQEHPGWTFKGPKDAPGKKSKKLRVVSEGGLLKDVGRGVVETAGFAEAPLQVASGIPSYLAGLVAQAGAGLYDIWKSGGQNIAGPEELAETFGSREDLKNTVAALGTYQPKTQLGQTISTVAMSPIALTMEGLDEASKLISDDPDTQKGVKFLGELLLLKIIPGAVKRFGSLGKATEGKAFSKYIKKELTKEMGREVELMAEKLGREPVGPFAMEIEGQPTLTTEGIANTVKLIKTLKVKSREQKASYGQEFGGRIVKGEAAARRVGGMEGFKAKLAQLKGEYKKVAPDFQALQEVLPEPFIHAAMNTIEYNPLLLGGEKLGAGLGFGKLLRGKLPQPRELELLQTVFGGDFVGAIMKKRPLLERAWSQGLEIANIPRSIMAGFLDLSFGGRQGIFGAPRYYKEFGKAWAKQFEMFGSERVYKALNEVIASDPYYKLAREGGVAFTELGKILGKREERFHSPLAEKIPIVGHGIRATGRAYTGMANKYRMDIFKRLAKDAEAMGHKLEGNTELLRAMGSYINVITGRGKLGKLESSASALNAVFFSPRLWSARLGITFGKYNPLNPLHYTRLPKTVRVEALKTWLAFAGAQLTVLGAAELAGADVGLNPLSPDFLKIKVGNTRITTFGGMVPPIRTAAQFIMGKKISSTTGKVRSISDRGYKPLTRAEIAGQHISYKEAPVASFVTDWMTGKTGMEKFSLSKEAKEKLIPIVAQDMYDIYKDDPGLFPAGLFSLGAIFGLGVQTYGKDKGKKGKFAQ